MYLPCFSNKQNYSFTDLGFSSKCIKNLFIFYYMHLKWQGINCKIDKTQKRVRKIHSVRAIQVRATEVRLYMKSSSMVSLLTQLTKSQVNFDYICSSVVHCPVSIIIILHFSHLLRNHWIIIWTDLSRNGPWVVPILNCIW